MLIEGNIVQIEKKIGSGFQKSTSVLYVLPHQFTHKRKQLHLSL